MGFLSSFIGGSGGPAVLWDPLWDAVAGDTVLKTFKDVDEQQMRSVGDIAPEAFTQAYEDTGAGKVSSTDKLREAFDSRGEDILRQRIGDETMPTLQIGDPSPLPTIFPLTAATGRLASSLAKQRERAQTKFSGGLDGGGNQPLSLFNI